MTPLPSLLRASAQDAANRQMRAANRSRWNDADWNLNAETLDRLVHGVYGRPGDHNDPDRCFLRFQLAERAEKQHLIGLRSTLAEIASYCEAA